jgi:hypothetical protein
MSQTNTERPQASIVLFARHRADAPPAIAIRIALATKPLFMVRRASSNYAIKRDAFCHAATCGTRI